MPNELKAGEAAVSTSKRIAFSIIALVIAVSTVGAMDVISGLHYGLGSTLRNALRTLEVLPAYLLFALPGWLLALPFVILFRNAEGRRAWITIAFGTAIGPIFIGIWTILGSRGHLVRQGDGFAIVMALWIAFLTSSSYVILLLRFSRRPSR